MIKWTFDVKALCSIMFFATGLKLLRQNSAAESISPGDRVLVAGKRTGTVHFVGNTDFAPGMFI